MLRVVDSICEQFCYALNGWFVRKPFDEHPYPAFDEAVARYRARWTAAGIATDASMGVAGKEVMQGVYPVDASPENLSRFLADSDGALDALGPLAADPFLRSRMILVTLADNSD